MKRQRSRSHLEILRDINRMEMNKGRARSLTFGELFELTCFEIHFQFLILYLNKFSF